MDHGLDLQAYQFRYRFHHSSRFLYIVGKYAGRELDKASGLGKDDNVFGVFQGKKQRDKGIKELRNHLRHSYIPRKRKLMILFPEGGFLRKRREISQKYVNFD